MKRMFALVGGIACALAAASTVQAAHTPAVLYVGCVKVTTDNRVLLLEAGPAGTGMVSTDEEGIGGYARGDGDSDDVAVSRTPCAPAGSPVVANDGWVASGTAPFGEIQPRTCQAIQQLIDGTYPGIDGVYRTPIATRNQDGSWSLTDRLPAGYSLDGRAVGGDFTDPAAATFPVDQAFVDPHSVLPGQLDACVYLTAVKATP